MPRYSKLEGRIVEKYGTKQNFASAVGIPAPTLSRKLNGHFEFKRSEIARMIHALDIRPKDVGLYFFSEKS